MTPSSALTLVAPSSPSDRSSEFVPVSGGQETTSAAGLLITAYVLMWACVFALIWLSLKRLSSVDRRLADLERQLTDKERSSQGSPTP